jgi:hypothetical protein
LAAPRFSRTEVVTPVTGLSEAPELEPVQAVGALEVPDAPDYEIATPAFGQGSFGKVWVARTSIGQWVALKAVYQSKFGSNPKPYEREFNGLRRLHADFSQASWLAPHQLHQQEKTRGLLLLCYGVSRRARTGLGAGSLFVQAAGFSKSAWDPRLTSGSPRANACGLPLSWLTHWTSSIAAG